MPFKQIDSVITLAAKINAIVFLDIPGWFKNSAGWEDASYSKNI